MSSFESLLAEVRACTICAKWLPHGVRPVLQLHPDARILVTSQAPGRRVHETGVPFDDASGERLRDWMGVTREEFYDARLVAILPMGFCFPGTGASGDLPPRRECAPAWRVRLLERLPRIELTLLVGQYALAHHQRTGGERRASLTQAVRDWRAGCWQRSEALPLPHPSPRNNIWLSRNPWFGEDVLPALRQRVRGILRRAR